ncbi:MAG: hypothetical protein JXR94_18525 [Candidatus Hydrogenedentes bacterium]|nr:hypothetical protein [Candidatus Hydrogenedentota bacterium]
MRQQNVLSDADAVRRVLGGRRDDFAILVRRYLPAMQALAYSTTGSRQDAEDVAQESFLTAFRHLDSLREPERFACWLASIVKNTARSLLRGIRRCGHAGRRRARRSRRIRRERRRLGRPHAFRHRRTRSVMRPRGRGAG